MLYTVQMFSLGDFWLSEHPDESADLHNDEDNGYSVLFQAGEQRQAQWGLKIQKKNWLGLRESQYEKY